KETKKMPFAQLLTNKASLKELKDAEKETEKKANEIKCKKKSATQKRLKWEAKKA
ncbi:27420_t:CDS:1, partial [Racocetra persica]